MNQALTHLFKKTSALLLIAGVLVLRVTSGLYGQTNVTPPNNAKIAIKVHVVATDPVAQLGAHTLAYHRLSGSVSPLTSSGITTQSNGSTLLACVGRGRISDFSLPQDNKGNTPWIQLDATHPYALWGDSGTALYAFASAAGGAGHTVTTSKPRADEEITMAVVEVVKGGLIQDYKWNETLSGSPTTSLSVTTTGPATLVAFWWGDAGVDSNKTAVPNNGFTVIDSILESGALVQCAVAAKEVAVAGTYNVTWTATPQQGAQLWLVAVQYAP